MSARIKPPCPNVRAAQVVAAMIAATARTRIISFLMTYLHALGFHPDRVESVGCALCDPCRCLHHPWIEKIINHVWILDLQDCRRAAMFGAIRGEPAKFG